MIRRIWLGSVGVGCCVATLSSWAPSASGAVLVAENWNPGFSFINTYGLWPGVEPNSYAPFGVGHSAPTTQFPVPTLTSPFPAISPISGSESFTIAQYRTPFGDRFVPDTDPPLPQPYYTGESVNEFNLTGTEENPAESTMAQRDLTQYDADGKAILRFTYRASLADVAMEDRLREYPEFEEAVSEESIRANHGDDFQYPPDFEPHTRIFDVPVIHDQGVWATFALSFFDNYNTGGDDELRTSQIACFGTPSLDGTCLNAIDNFDYVELTTDGEVHTMEVELTLLSPELRADVDWGNIFGDPEDPAYLDNHDTAESLWVRLWGSAPRVVTFDSFELCPLSGCPVDEGLEGDFNEDGFVDAADYTYWRDRAGIDFDASDYDKWKANFGASSGGAGSSLALSGVAVPEPSSLLILVLGFVGCARRRMRSAA